LPVISNQNLNKYDFSDFIWDTFSKERVLNGGFDKYIKSDTIRKGTSTVDKEFPLFLDVWRTRLAISITKNNPQIQEDELNFVVQQAIDRIVFLRISEERGVEPYGSSKFVLIYTPLNSLLTICMWKKIESTDSVLEIKPGDIVSKSPEHSFSEFRVSAINNDYIFVISTNGEQSIKLFL
jgi:hypothetical protein